MPTKERFCARGASARAVARGRSVYIPAAYTDVRSSCSGGSSLQATAVDASGKRQYFYSGAHRVSASESKWKRVALFAERIPEIRRRVFEAVTGETSSKERALGVGIMLLDECNFRVGGGSSKSKATGVSTLRSGDVDNASGKIEFTGKSGVRNTCHTDATRLLGSEFFEERPTAREMNDFLSRFGPFSSKDFRTLKANVLFIKELQGLDRERRGRPSESSRSSKTARLGDIRRAVKATAVQMHHTPSVCRSNYLHPGILRSYADKGLSVTGRASSPVDIFKGVVSMA
jgi:DNA topoisomerase-1